jgi:peptidoglycan hydrolase-like protein with peptidoglycan-binding domain
MSTHRKGTTMRTIITLAFLAFASPALAQESACAVQEKLKVLGYFDHEVTCQLGPITEAAIRAFQRDRGLYVDGRVGADTAKQLFSRRADDDERKAPAERREHRRAMSDQEEFSRCGDDAIEATVERLGKARGLNGAIKAWEAKVYGTEGLGIRYGDWANATDKFQECLPASAGSRFTWNCTVRAKPCKAGE